jgi:tRNA A-37 threonylcarbamoyl transferase component Bud32
MFIPASFAVVGYVTPLRTLLFTFYLAGPVAFAYAVLRHRVFDLGVIFRRGLQYALARRLLVSAVPVLAAIFLADLLLHGDQPILAVFRARGWMYAALAALAAVAYARRQNWLDALDRRFFREHYDARRLLREVVEEVRAARSLEQEAEGVVNRIETALHPEFVALLVSEPHEHSYRTLAAAPMGKGPPSLRKESKVLSLMHLLGKPLEVPQSESGWLQQQLPHEETDFLRQARIDLLVTITTNSQRTEALLALGAKRSEEPYSGEDQDLLVAVAASLAMLLEKPAAAALARSDIFEECPQCGACYDSGSSECTKEGAHLVPVVLPRLLEKRYRLDRRLGRGGMGTVYAASDNLLERRVAVKVIREDLVGSAEAAERFRREARAAASFAHPNVVSVYDFGVASGTRAFLVMEILEGCTLRERLRPQKRLPPAELLRILRDVCAALSAAHHRHLVHRDLKPENIFLVTIESGEVAKVLDFGVAKFLSKSTEQLTADTAAGAVLGTPRYMSPEQRRGLDAHEAWDLWALAVMAYEMLTGSYPFEDRSPDWLAGGISVPFTPVDKYMPQGAEKWQELFEHSFARELESRHDSVEAFLSEIQSATS